MSNLIRHIAIPWALALVALAMLILVNLSGASQSSLFLQQLYLLEVSMSRDYFWTLYNFCSKTSEGFVTCTRNYAAYPYAPYELSSRIEKSQVFFYALRAAYGLFVAGVAFTFTTTIMAAMALLMKKTRPYTLFRYSLWLAYLTSAIAAALETALHTLGRNSFETLGYTARLGVKMMVFMWVGAGFLFLACLFLCYSAPPVFSDTYQTRYNENTNGPMNNPEMLYVPSEQPQGYQNYNHPYPQQGYMGYNQNSQYNQYNQNNQNTVNDENEYHRYPNQYR